MRNSPTSVTEDKDQTTVRYTTHLQPNKVYEKDVLNYNSTSKIRHLLNVTEGGGGGGRGTGGVYNLVGT